LVQLGSTWFNLVQLGSTWFKLGSGAALIASVVSTSQRIPRARWTSPRFAQ